MGIRSKFLAVEAASQLDVPDQLRQLARLCDSDVLTDAECVAQKRRLFAIQEAELCADAAAASA